MNFGVALAGSGPNKRRDHDDYQTVETEVTTSFLNTKKGKDLLNRQMVVREPACGKGFMADVMKNAGLKVISTDLIDRGYGDGVIDWLTEKDTRGCTALVTNPPFTIKNVGNGQTLFLKKAIELDFQFVAMFAKIQFWNASTRLDLWNLWRPAAVYPLTWRPDFTGQGRPTMDCMWIVWDRLDKKQDCVFEPIKKPEPVFNLEAMF